jgi:ArsR family transcriptional regulator, lead/cadmium/zinc/bismuth-responsive transcriptional repressor
MRNPRPTKACDATRERRPLKERPLLTPIKAGGLAAVFKVLGNDTRLRMLHAIIRAGEICVTDLGTTLGLTPQTVSNQLQRLSDLGILSSRRDGKNIYYRLVDLCVSGVLEQVWCMVDETGGGAGVTGWCASEC